MLTRLDSRWFSIRMAAFVLLTASAWWASAVSDASIAPPPNGKELGRVLWQRDLDAALDAARKTGRPVFLLFQEVPGRPESVRFGETVLDHPGIADLIESEFLPVVVRNNEPGPAAEILERFSEPAWTTPVVRFLDANGLDIIPRKAGVASAGEIAERMIAALEAAGRSVPEALHLFAAELDLARLRRAAFATAGSADGEAVFGRVPGVVAARAAWSEGNEAVEVVYNERAVCEDTLQELARDNGFARIGAAGLAEADAAIRGLSLADSGLRFLPLTPAQASRVNAALRHGEDPDRFLTPRQATLAREVATAIAAGGLAGLERPNDVSLLPGYERLLLRRLDEAKVRN